ncbi:unnamed protein product [Heterosigma akashiwo]
MILPTYKRLPHQIKVNSHVTISADRSLGYQQKKRRGYIINSWVLATHLTHQTVPLGRKPLALEKYVLLIFHQPFLRATHATHSKLTGDSCPSAHLYSQVMTSSKKLSHGYTISRARALIEKFI